MPQAPAAHQIPANDSNDSDERASTPDAASKCPHQRLGGCMALASDTPVPTPTGWSVLSRLRPGSRVLDPDGEPCTVTAVCPRARQDVFRIVFDDDFSLMAGARQPWVTLTHSRRFRMHTKRLKLSNWASMLMPQFTEDIRSCLVHKRGFMLRESMHSIPLALPLRLPERSLRIDPYLLGLWLGDGTSTAAAITSHADDEPHYRSRAEAAGERWRARKGHGDVLTCVLTRGPVPLFWTRLNRMGLARNKHVPMEYLRSGENQRLALLQGLMDSDGYIDDVGGKAEFTSTSERLARATLELLLTLGQKPTLGRGDATLDGRIIGDKWRVHFSPTLMAVSLPRKVERLAPFLETRKAPALSRLDQRYIRSVEPEGTADTSCLEVDSDSGLFLSGTHLVPVSGRVRV